MRHGVRGRIAAPALLVAAALMAAAAAHAEGLGRWSPVADWPMIPIHAVLTPDGRVMSFGATLNDKAAGFDYDVWDPALGTGPEAHVTLPNGTPANTFCAAQAIAPWDGGVLVAGGNGVTTSDALDATRLRRTPLASTLYPRWYGTLTGMPDGRLVMQGGARPYDWNQPSLVPELYDRVRGWQTLPGAVSEQAYGSYFGGAEENRGSYPRAWPEGDDRVFVLTGRAMFALSIVGEGHVVGPWPFDRETWGATSTAVMFEPGRILQVGGGSYNATARDVPGSTAASVIAFRHGDRLIEPPLVRDTAPLRFGRHWANATVLPNGEVLVTGGSRVNNALDGAAYAAEIWNPRTETWRTDAAAAVPRLYHSIALLLPDGRVLVGGGGAEGPIVGRNVELYTPSYLFGPDGGPAQRPLVLDGPGLVGLGQSFSLRVVSRRPIRRVTLVRAGAVTHSLNTGQTFTDLAFRQEGDTVRVAMTFDRLTATPGYYMVFAIDDTGAPSVGRIVKVPVPAGGDDLKPPGVPASNTWTAPLLGRDAAARRFELLCAPGEVMAGVFGEDRDGRLARLGPRCAPVRNGRLQGEPTDGGMAGEGGGTPFRKDCGPGAVVVGLGGRADDSVAAVSPVCAPRPASLADPAPGSRSCARGTSAYGLYGQTSGARSLVMVGLLCATGATLNQVPANR